MPLASNQEIELELTYLASRLPSEIEGVQPVHMVDVYVPETAPHPHLRLRQKNDKYEVTKKEPIDGADKSESLEQTIPLTKDEFEALMGASSKRVEKDRYKVAIVGKQAEVDVFKGALSGLVLIDFEFKTSQEKDSFVAPDCCLADVTQEEFIAGGILSGKSYQDIFPRLEAYNYKSLNV
jgi:CYTH domain-containing protein